LILKSPESDRMTSPLTARTIARLSPLPRSFYDRDPRLVARELLGKLLIRCQGGPHPPSFGECGEQVILAGRIVEAEAYLGAIDPGAHSYRGLTPRNAVLFGPPGHAYIYFIYGNHYCTNVSCQAPGEAGGVLLRALEPVCGLDEMRALRGIPVLGANPTRSQLRQLTSGPGRLSQALAITRARDNGCDLCSRSSGLYIADDGQPAAAISATPRINVTHAPHDEWRFILTGNPFVSGKKALS
jgi:DNA-3-methyladenine glycosylase